MSHAVYSIGSWMYDGSDVKLELIDSDGLDLDDYNSACPLAVESHTAVVVDHTYDCCEETYPAMDIAITFVKRQ